MRRLINVLPSLMALLVGACSFAISYNTLRLEAVALRAVPGGWPSYLVPLILDGAVVSGSAVLWKASALGRRRQWFPFLFVGALVALSVVVNVAHAGQTPLARAIAALPPLVLLGCLELVVVSHRSAAEEAAQVERAAGQPAGDGAAGAAVLVEAPSALEAPGGARSSAAQAPTQTGAPADGDPAPPRPDPVVEPLRRPVETTAAGRRAVGATAAPSAPQVAAPEVAGARRAPAAPSRRHSRVRAQEPADVAAGPAAESGTGGSAADRIRERVQAHLEQGGSAADTGLARRLAGELEVSDTYVRRVLGQLRRELELAS